MAGLGSKSINEELSHAVSHLRSSAENHEAVLARIRRRETVPGVDMIRRLTDVLRTEADMSSGLLL